MTSVCKNNYGKCAQECHCTLRLEDAEGALVLQRFGAEMINHENDEVANGYQGNDAGIFERVESSKETQGNDEEHESRDPKVPVREVRSLIRDGAVEPEDNLGHEIADDDQVGNTHSEALDGDGGVEEDRGVRIRELGDGEEGRAAALEVPGASALEVQAEGCREARPEDHQRSEEDAHVGKHRWHGKRACSDDGVEEVDDAAGHGGLATALSSFPA